MHDCKQTHRLDRVEADLRDVEGTLREHGKDLQGLKEGQAETRVYVKHIFERLDELKVMLHRHKGQQPDNIEHIKLWSKVVLALVGILGGIIASVRILG